MYIVSRIRVPFGRVVRIFISTANKVRSRSQAIEVTEELLVELLVPSAIAQRCPWQE